MPVTFKGSLSTLSNKQNIDNGVYSDNGYVLDKDDIAYEYDVPSHGKVFFLKPKIDFLSITFPIADKEDQEGISALLVNAVKDPDLAHFTDPTGNPSPGYKLNVDLTYPATSSRIQIQAKPTNASTSFMRFTLNPAKLGPLGVTFFKDQLKHIFLAWYSYANILSNGKVTRIDAAVDVINYSISDMLIRYLGHGKSHMYFGTNHKIETAYSGITPSQKSGNYYAYNKRQQIKDKGRDPKFDGVPWTRIEVRVKKGKPLAGLLPMETNPLKNYSVYCPSNTTAPEQQHHWQLFIDSCWHRGVDAALALLPDELASSYGEALEDCKEGFWKPEQLWSHWPASLEATGLLES